ncbi:PI31 proteasome regulator N-terminal-domain-containing protein [Xylariaceae sp. FL0255]|nr:PI31 proteasome regulator N-terminal-domain-containing protein [Xylariaceae sp. FL0255]
MTSNPLSSAAVLQSMADALTTHEPNDTTSDLSSSHEALALFTHGCMISLGFRLLGFDEDKIDEARCHELAPRLPPNWNASFNTYAFVYAHQQSALRFIIKIDRMGGKAEIRGLAVQDERIARAEIVIKDFISNTALPIRITMTDDGSEDRSDLPQKIGNAFISDNRVTDLATLIKVNIIQKLLPALQKEGYEETPQDPDDTAAQDDVREAARRPPRQPVMPDPMPQPAQPNPYGDPLGPLPRRPGPDGGPIVPPDEDWYDINRPRAPLAPGRTPFGNVGHDDLYPAGLGPHDPLRPGLSMPGGLPRPGGGSGMHPTFDDPLFGGDGNMGGDFDPQVPPGARYDPIGPGGVPRFGGGRRPGRGGGGEFGPGFGGGFGGGDII